MAEEDHKEEQDGAITITRAICIQWQGLSTPWLIRDFVTKEDRDFIPLYKRDSGLAKFVTGTSYAHPLRDYVWLKELVQRRDAAAFPNVQKEGAFGNKISQYRLRLDAKKRKMDPSNEVDQSSPTVDVSLPHIHHEGKDYGPITMRMIRPTTRGQRSMVECSAENLEYVKVAILEAGKLENASSRKTPIKSGIDGIKWASCRKAWRVTRADGTSRLVRPEDPEDAMSRDVAKELAEQWINGADIDDEEDNVGDDPEGDGDEEEAVGSEANGDVRTSSSSESPSAAIAADQNSPMEDPPAEAGNIPSDAAVAATVDGVAASAVAPAVAPAVACNTAAGDLNSKKQSPLERWFAKK